MADRKIIELLKKLEWASWTDGAPSSMGANDGAVIRCCPCCNGVHPEEGKNEFSAHSLGHRRTCELAKAIKGK